MKRRLKATIDNIALAALVFAVVAIAAVSTVAVVSVESLIATNEKVLRAQRVASSLESIRFNALGLDMGEKGYLITGNERDLARYLAGTVEIESELAYLAEQRADHATLAARFVELDQAARQVIASERIIVEARRTQGFATAQALVRAHMAEQKQERLILVTRELLVASRRQHDVLEADQVAYGDKVRRLILALISSSAFILVFLYGTLRRLNKEQRSAQTRIAYQATHDSLTDLLNRPAVMEHISARLQDAQTEAALGGFALLLMDLDGFKAVNDSLGHDAGDSLLQQVAQRALRELRDSDLIARLGGDEFLIVIPQVSGRENASRIAAKLIAAVAGEFVLGKDRVRITASIGISVFPEDARERESLMKCADLALYQAKRAGRNNAQFYRPEMRGGTSA